MADLNDSADEPWWSEFWWQQSQQGRRDPVLAAASTRGFVLSSHELSECGVSRAAVRTLVAQRRWTRAGHGFVAPLPAPSARHTHALAASSAARRRPADAVSGRSAAVVHALPVMGLPARPRLTLRDASLGRARASSAGCFTGWLAAEEMADWYGISVATPARTLVDLARHDRFDGIMAADAALRMKIVSAEQIENALDRAAGWPGVRRAREVLARADPRSESPLESVTRLRLHDDGFPPPELQFWIGGYRVDLCWPALRLVLEVDGRVKYTANGEALWLEKRRETVVRRHGYRVERVIAADVYRNWPATSAYLRPLFRLPRRVG